MSRRRPPTWRLTDRGWFVLTCSLCLLVAVLTWTVIPVITPWATRTY